MTDLTFTLSGTAMSQVEGSELTQRPERYDNSPATLRAGAALNSAQGRRRGKGWSYSVSCDAEAAAVILEYFQTQAEIFLGGMVVPEGRADGRAYRKAAENIKAALDFHRELAERGQ